MPINNIVFLNHKNYGNIFYTREYIRDIQSQLTDFRFGYAHQLNNLILKDFNFISLSAEKNTQILQMIDQNNKFAQSDDTIFINTSPSAWKDVYTGNEPTFNDCYGVYQNLYTALNQNFNLNLTFRSSVREYLPEVDYTFVETDKVHSFIDNKSKGKIYLFCNNFTDYPNDYVGSMESIIESMARNYPNDTFVATHGFATSLDNIHFTLDIFSLNNDLLEISYLSKFADVIIGKNNGPYTYTLTKSNLNSSNKNFVCITNNYWEMLTHSIGFPASVQQYDNIEDKIDMTFYINSVIKQSRETNT